MKHATVAITGAAGFLGRAVLARLEREPEIGRVVAIDRVTRADTDKVRWVAADVRDRGFASVLAGVDAVAHLAFVVLGDLREAESINVGGSANVFDAAGRAGCRRLVFLSSVAAYGLGRADRLLTEADPLQPLLPFTYSRTKAAAERALDVAEARHPALSVARLRPCIILGPGCHKPLALWSSKRVQLGLGRGLAIQVVHLDDVVEAVRLALLSDARGAFNIAAPGAVTGEDFARLAGARMLRLPRPFVSAGARFANLVLPRRDVTGWLSITTRPPSVATARAERELGWTPTRTALEVAGEFVKGGWAARRAA